MKKKLIFNIFSFCMGTCGKSDYLSGIREKLFVWSMGVHKVGPMWVLIPLNSSLVCFRWFSRLWPLINPSKSPLELGYIKRSHSRMVERSSRNWKVLSSKPASAVFLRWTQVQISLQVYLFVCIRTLRGYS